ncbi:lysozyme inhibitor LprI family protein [Winogradskyella haliclonae]|nr:lysozyme inhibitor LprI family protein [Winogradskyella haliclonae]
MIYKRLIILLFCFPVFSISQNTKDVGFLKDMPYLKYKINCDSTSGSNIEHRICLNIELRKTDSLMLSKFNKYIALVDSDSTKIKLKDFQKAWEKERKILSQHMSDGLEGNSEAIIYMHSMLTITEHRIRTLDFLLEDKF